MIVILNGRLKVTYWDNKYICKNLY